MNLEAAAPGFKTNRTTGILVEVGEKLEINPRLEVGQAAESITISAAAVGLDTTSGTVSGVVEARKWPICP